MDISICNEDVPNCGKNQVPIQGQCYPISSTCKSGCKTFSSSPNIPNKNVIGTFTGLSIEECMLKAVGQKDSSAIEYDYNSDKCTVYGSQSNIGEDLEMKASLTTPCNVVYEIIENPDTNCVSGSNPCINIIESDGSGSVSQVSIDMAKGVDRDTIQRIQGDYTGVVCRKEVVTNSSVDNTNVLQGMGEWCKNNSDKKVCTEFCSNSSNKNYCLTKKFPTSAIILLILFLVFVIVGVVLYRKNDVKMASVFGVISIGLLVASLYYIVKFIKVKKGEEPDYKSPPAPQFTNKCITNDGFFWVKNPDEGGYCKKGSAPSGQTNYPSRELCYKDHCENGKAGTDCCIDFENKADGLASTWYYDKNTDKGKCYFSTNGACLAGMGNDKEIINIRNTWCSPISKKRRNHAYCVPNSDGNWMNCKNVDGNNYCKNPNTSAGTNDALCTLENN